MFQFVYADPKSAGNGDKYRRKSKPCGNLSVNFELDRHSGCCLSPAKGDKSRKRPRVLISEGRELWKFAEAIESRLFEVETQSPEPSLTKVLNAIDFRVSKLEARLHTDSQGDDAVADTDSQNQVPSNRERLATLAVCITRLEQGKRITYDYR